MIRIAQTSDWPQMQVIFAAAGKAAWAHILPPDFLATLTVSERWRDAIEDPSQRVLIGDLDGIARGFAILRPSRDDDSTPSTGELHAFFTHPDVWGLGVGRLLLPSSVEHLREMGFEEATLWTGEQNHRPRAIYDRAGWKLDGCSRERVVGGGPLFELRYRIDLR